MNRNDEKLVEDYLGGDKDAYTEIVTRYLKPIYNFIYRLIGNEKEAEDISQIVFLKAWKNIKKFDTDKSFKTWIFSIAKNASIDYLRKRKDIPMSSFENDAGDNPIADNLVSEERGADKVFAQSQDKKQIEIMMRGLSVEQKEVIILKYVNEMSLSETAEIMNMSKDTVKSHHRRALLKMRESIDSRKVHPIY